MIEIIKEKNKKIDKIDKIKKNNKIEKAEKTSNTDKTSKTEKAEKTDKTSKTDKTDKIDNTDKTEIIKNDIKIQTIIEELSELENISPDILIQYIKSFEKYIKSETKKYEDITGLEDYKMRQNDYNILYNLYINTNSTPYKIHIILLYMYSYYKLDGISFDKNYFPLKLFFNFIKNNINIHSLILKMMKIDKTKIK